MICLAVSNLFLSVVSSSNSAGLSYKDKKLIKYILRTKNINGMPIDVC